MILWKSKNQKTKSSMENLIYQTFKNIAMQRAFTIRNFIVQNYGDKCLQ